MLHLLLLLPLLLFSHTGLAGCAPHKVTEPSQVRLKGDAVMIVTHSTSTHDARFSTKRGLDEAIRFARSNRIPVIYLQDDTPEAFYFMEDCTPDYWVYSQGGEISFDVTPNHLYIVGGHLELCMSATLHNVLYQWARKAPRNLTVT
jgi:hypothetical protein